jgi:hypothetical protein
MPKSRHSEQRNPGTCRYGLLLHVSNGKRARGTACAYQASEALAETGGPVLSLIAVKKE